MGIGKVFKNLGKVGLGGVAGIVANGGKFPAMSGIGAMQRLMKRREDGDDGERRPMDERMLGRGDRPANFKKGGKVKKMAKGGSTASKRADGCATKGKTKGRFV